MFIKSICFFNHAYTNISKFKLSGVTTSSLYNHELCCEFWSFVSFGVKFSASSHTSLYS